MRLTLRLLAPAALVLATTCGAFTSPTDTLLQTDATTYGATARGNQVEIRLITTYRNPADTLITLARCTPTSPYPIYFVDLVTPASAEGAGYNPAWACVGHNSPLVVGPGTVRVDTITLRGPSAFDSKTQKYVGVIAGRFRISYGGQQSNEFTIKLRSGGVFP